MSVGDTSKRYKLTIAIPVYNGSIYIQETLNSITAQPWDACDIEILISNNASTDNTETIVQEYSRTHNIPISYFRNVRNFGFDGNIDLVVSRARGEYVWILGCGERLRQGCILSILSLLRSDEYDNVLLNFDIITSYASNKQTEVKNNFNIFGNRIFLSRDLFFLETKFGITPISANIVRKESWNAIADEPLLTVGWCHVERIIRILSRSAYKKSLLVGDICFSLIRDDTGWWMKDGNLLHNAMKMRKIIQQLLDKPFNRATKTALLEESYQSTFQTIRQSKTHGLRITKKILRDAISCYSSKMSFWLFLLPLLTVPGGGWVQGRFGKIFYYAPKLFFKFRNKVLHPN